MEKPISGIHHVTAIKVHALMTIELADWLLTALGKSSRSLARMQLNMSLKEGIY
jgi:hypothetical protein